MAERKAGRPKGAQNKVGKDEKEFIKGLLGESQEEYRDAFLFYAKNAANNAEDRKFFVTLRNELTKMIVPKPVEIDATIEASDFEALLGMASKWDDET
jgi:hypothetical protein